MCVWGEGAVTPRLRGELRGWGVSAVRPNLNVLPGGARVEVQERQVSIMADTEKEQLEPFDGRGVDGSAQREIGAEGGGESRPQDQFPEIGEHG